MKLTPRSQGFRFTHRFWAATQFVDIRKVGREILSGIDQDEQPWTGARDDMDKDWIRIGSTKKLREQASEEK